jgi:hypothetical protein
MAPDVTGRLEATLRNGRRRSQRRKVRAGLAFATVTLAVVLVGPPFIDALRNRERGVGASPSPTQTVSLSGTYATTLVSTDVAVTSNRMAGDWTIGFGSSGILTVTAPPDFTGTYSGYSFDVSGSQFTTDLFGEDVCSTLLPGTYRWSLSGGRLAFTVVDDSCPGRVAVLTSAAWNATPAR